jgi:hypothetical protein
MTQHIQANTNGLFIIGFLYAFCGKNIQNVVKMAANEAKTP